MVSLRFGALGIEVVGPPAAQGTMAKESEKASGSTEREAHAVISLRASKDAQASRLETTHRHEEHAA